MNRPSKDHDRILRQIIGQIDQKSVFVFQWHQEIVLKEGRDCLVSERNYRVSIYQDQRSSRVYFVETSTRTGLDRLAR